MFPDLLARVLAPVLDSGAIERMEGAFSSGGIEFPCKCVLYFEVCVVNGLGAMAAY